MEERVKPKSTTARARPTALAVTSPPEGNALTVFERLARDPKIPVEKLERLIALQENIQRIQARAAYTSAFVHMQADLPAVKKNGRVVVKGALRSRYAKLDDIQTAVKPVLLRYGFSLRHRTEWPAEGIIRVVGILAHEAGHTEESTFEAPLDKSEFRTEIQSMGSTVSYGRRYTTIDLLNLTQQGVDDDGAKGRAPEGPAGATVVYDPRQGAPSSDPRQGEPITEAQRKRLWVIIKSSGRAETEVHMWLKAALGIDSTKAIARGQYERVCAAIEQQGALPMPPEGDGRA